MENISTKTLATIVTENSQTAPVLEKYSLDFCCNGKRTLAEACAEKGLSLDAISIELENQIQGRKASQMPFTEMTPDQIISYILIHHHFYVKQALPTIEAHLEKVATKHGSRFPYMVEVFELFKAVKADMTMHMQKEEMILFPRIKKIAELMASNEINQNDIDFIAAPIRVMLAEHDHVGELLFKIRDLTNYYQAPENACNTFRLSLAELKEFEEDLHKHVHAENNHLFPKAVDLLQS